MLIGRDFDFRRGGERLAAGARPPSAPPLPLPPFGGDEQFANAAACAAVVDASRRGCPCRTPRSRPESRSAYLRGRLERHAVDGVEWVFDVGHNPAAATGSRRRSAVCRAAARTWVVFAAMRDKDLAGVVEPLVATAAGWFVTQASADRGATGEPSSATLLESLGARARRRGRRRRSRLRRRARGGARRRSRRRLRLVSSPWAPRPRRFGYTAHPPHWLTDPPHGPGFEGTTRRRGRARRDRRVADSVGARRSRKRRPRRTRSSLQLPAAEEPMPMRTQTLRLGEAAEPSAELAETPPRRRRRARGGRRPRPRRDAERSTRAAAARARAAANAERTAPCRERAPPPVAVRQPRRRRSPRRAAASGDWIVQLGSFSEEANARRLAQRASTFGYKAEVSSYRAAAANAVSRARRAGDHARRGRRRRHRRCAPTASTRPASWPRAEPLNDPGRLRHRVPDPRLAGRRCVARVHDRGDVAGHAACRDRLGLAVRGQSRADASATGSSAAEVRLWAARVIDFRRGARGRWPRLVACAKIDPAYRA